MSSESVDPPGLEPGLCGTKIRRVANYTMGQSNLKRCCKIRKKIIELSRRLFNADGKYYIYKKEELVLYLFITILLGCLNY